MRITRSLIALATVLLVCGVAGAQQRIDPNRNWQDGFWRDTDRLSTYAGSVSNGSSDGNDAIPDTSYSQIYVIDAKDKWYLASLRLKRKSSKPVPMTINAPVRFALVKDKIYVIGEDRKEYELAIVKARPALFVTWEKVY